jgi:ribose transport system permease protein
MSNTTASPGPRTGAPQVDDRALSGRSPFKRWLLTRPAWILGLDIALVVLFTILSTNQVFFSLANFQSLMLTGTESLILALGLTMMLGAGVFDLSLGANLILSSVVGAKVIVSVSGKADAAGAFPHPHLGILVGLLACLATGLIYGLVNGILIAYFDINSLIATLGTLGIGTGLALVLGNGSDVGGIPASLQTGFGLKNIAKVPVPALVALLLAAVLWAVVRYTRYGLRTLSIGSSRSAAERVGLKVRPHLLSLTIMAGMFAGLAGFIDLARFGSTSINGHPNDALAAVTAAVIGGTLLEGGRISVVGTIWGAGLAVILQGGLVIIGVSSAYQIIAVGTVLIFAVGLDRVAAQRRAKS